MEQLSLFPDLDPPLRVLLNQEGIDLFKVPRLDFTTKDPKKPNKARKINKKRFSNRAGRGDVQFQVGFKFVNTICV